MTARGPFGLGAAPAACGCVVDGDGGGVVEMRAARRLVVAVDATLPPRALAPDADYGFLLDDDPHASPDPRSRRQPGGVHGLSRTYDPAPFAWTRPGLDRAAAGRVGGLRAARRHLHARGHARRARSSKLDHLRVDRRRPGRADAGQRLQRHPQLGLRRGRLVRGARGATAARRRTSASSTPATPPASGVVQDVVYNHLGPSGNYLPLFGPYLKQGRNTWGDLVNLDGEGSAEVRRFILDNVRMWFEDYHVDALRLDAVHALVDTSPRAPARGDGDRDAGPVGAPAPAADADRRVRPQRPAAGHPARGRRLRPRRPVERRLPPRPPRRADRRDRPATTPTSSRCRRWPRCCEQRLLPRRHLVVVPRPRPRRPDRHRATCRPGGSSCAARTTTRSATARAGDRLDRAPRRRPARLRGAADAVRPVHADAVHGRGVGGVDAVPVLHLAPRAGARDGDRRGADRGVRADGLGPGRRARPAGPGDVRALEAGLVGARRPGGTPYSSTSTGGSPRCGGRAPS